MERAVITSTEATLRVGAEGALGLAPAAPRAAAPSSATPVPRDEAGAKTLSALEREHILATLEGTYWRLEGEGGAAALLGLNPSTLRSRMRKYGIRRPRPVA